MSRIPLPDRRPNVTAKVDHVFAGGRTQKLIVTFGLDAEALKNRKILVREIFCADFKEGTDLHTLITDACVCLSLLLQHGYSVSAVLAKMASAPKSLLYSLVEAAVQLEQDRDNGKV